jgi:hypothetical protein
MTDQAAQTHPSPHRHRASSARLLFAVAGAGAAWLVQLIVDYGLAAHRCYPHDTPLTAAQAGGGLTDPLLAIFNLIAIGLAAAAGLMSYRLWQQTREEHPGSAGHLVEAGEGRTRFLAMWGLLAGIGFLVAIVFDTVAVFTVPRCFA